MDLERLERLERVTRAVALEAAYRRWKLDNWPATRQAFLRDISALDLATLWGVVTWSRKC